MTNLPSKGRSSHPTMDDITITEPGVLKLLQSLKQHKASGPDQIPARVLKDLAPAVAPVLTKVFRCSLRSGCVPQDWLKADIVPIFKKGKKYLASNYRPVSLTSICSKLMEHILVSNIMKHLESHSILADQQHGFRKGRSTETQLILTSDDLLKSLDKNTQTDIIVMDFPKAFDKVPHQRLLHKIDY